MSPGNREKRIGERKREQIRTAAYRCFRDFGYHETTVDTICEASSSSKGSFYWHYSSKQEVFIDILDTWSREVTDELYEQFQGALQKEDHLRALAEALYREVRRGRVLVPLILEFTVRARQERDIRDAIAKFNRRARSAIAEILRPLLSGLASEEELRALAATFYAAYMGLMMQQLADSDGSFAHEAIEQFMTALRRWFHELRRAREASGESVAVEEATAPPPSRTAERADPAEMGSLLARVPEQQRQLAMELRELVLRAVPDADERVITGWKVIAFGGRRLFSYVKARRDSVHLGFYRGTDLPDPEGLMRGTGTKMRHVPLPIGVEVPTHALEALVRAAWRLDQQTP